MSAVVVERDAADVVCEVPLRDLIRGAWFCGNPACVLHVRTGDPSVAGSGEWAVRPDAVVTSRAMYGDQVLCSSLTK